MFTGSPAEGMQIRSEQEVVPLAKGDAQRTLDPRPLTDTPAIGGEVPKKDSGSCVRLSICGHKT